MDPPNNARKNPPKNAPKNAPQNPPKNARKPPRIPYQPRPDDEDLLDEITSAARCIDSARDWSGELVFRTDNVWRVLTTVARSPYCLAIADLGRALRISRQSAHELAHEAARARVIELATNHRDKRILQALLTPTGRAELAAARTARKIWLTTLLEGLGDRELETTIHVVRVVRQRLERDAREWTRLHPGQHKR